MNFLEQKSREKANQERLEAFEEGQRQKKKDEAARKLNVYYAGIQAKREETRAQVESFQNKTVAAAAAAAAAAAKLEEELQEQNNNSSITDEKEKNKKKEARKKQLQDEQQKAQQELAALGDANKLLKQQEEADDQRPAEKLRDQKKKEEYRLEREQTRERAREQQRLEQQQVAEQSIHQTRNNMQELVAMAQEQKDRIVGLQRSFAMAPVAATKTTTTTTATAISSKDNAPSRPKRHSTYTNDGGGGNRHARRSSMPNSNSNTNNNSSIMGGTLGQLVRMNDNSSSSGGDHPIMMMTQQQQPDMDWSDKHHVKVATRRASMAAAGMTMATLPPKTKAKVTTATRTATMHDDYSEQIMEFGDDSHKSHSSNSNSKTKRIGGGSGRKGVQRQRSSSLSDMKRTSNNNRRTKKTSSTSNNNNKDGSKSPNTNTAAEHKTTVAATYYDWTAPDFNWSSFEDSSNVNANKSNKSPKSNRRSTLAVVAVAAPPNSNDHRRGGLTRQRSSSLSDMNRKGTRRAGRNTTKEKNNTNTKSGGNINRSRSKSVGRGRSRSRSSSSKASTTTTTKPKPLLDSSMKTPSSSSRGVVARQRSSSLSELKKKKKKNGGMRSGGRRRDRSRSTSGKVRSSSSSGRKSVRATNKDKTISKDDTNNKKSDKEMNDSSSPPLLKRVPPAPKRGVDRKRSSSLSGIRVSRVPSASKSKTDNNNDKAGGDDNDEEGPNAFFDWIAHSQDAIGRLESQKAALEERRKKKKEKRKEVQKLEAQSRAKNKKSKNNNSLFMDDSFTTGSKHKRGGKKKPDSVTADESRSEKSSVAKLESPPSTDTLQDKTKKREQNGKEVVPLPQAPARVNQSGQQAKRASTGTRIPTNKEKTKPASSIATRTSTTITQLQVKYVRKEPGHHSSSPDVSMDISKNSMDASAKNKDSSRRRGSIFGKVFKKGDSTPASSSLDTTDPSMDASDENVDASTMSATGKDVSRRMGGIFGKAVKNAKAFIHRPSDAKHDSADAKDAKHEKETTTTTAALSSSTEATKKNPRSVPKSMDVEISPKPIQKKAKVVPTSIDVEVNPRPPKKSVAVAADKATKTGDQRKKTSVTSSAKDTTVDTGAGAGGIGGAKQAGNNQLDSTGATTEANSNQSKGKHDNPAITKGAPTRGRTNAETAAPKRGVPRQRSSSLTDMVREKIRAGLKPKPRESVMQFVPTVPKYTDFVEDDYQESPLRQLDTYEDELTLEQLRQKVAKLEKQLNNTEDSEAREVEEVVQSGRDMFEKVAKKAGQVSGLPSDTSQVDDAVRRNNEIIKYLKSENQKRREEQKKIKTNFFDLHQSTMRLEKQTEQTLGFLEQLEDVHYQRELDKRTSLLRGIAACREGDEKLSEELQRQTSYVEFETRVRILYEEEMAKLLLAFDGKYGGTALSTLLNEIAAGNHDERLDAVIRFE